MVRRWGTSGLVGRLLRPLRRLAPGRAESPPSDSLADERLVDETFCLALGDMASDEAGRFQTRLQIISLIEFREAVGDKWGRIADKVMLIAEGVIKHHLGEGNSFTRQGQDFFVLLFRSCPQDEGRRRALVIAQELGTRLLGDQFVGMTVPLALAAEVALADVLNPDGSLDPAPIHAAIGEMRALLAVEAPPPPPSRLAAPPEGDARARLHRLEAESGTGAISIVPVSGRQAGGHPPPPPMALSACSSSSGDDPAWRRLEVARPKRGSEDPAWAAVERPMISAKAEAKTPLLPPEAKLSLLWRPTWVAEGEAISAYKAQIQRVDLPGQPPLEGARAYPAAGGEHGIALDRFAAQATAAELTGAAPDSPLAILPLHWGSLASPRRAEVTAALADPSGSANGGRLMIDLFGLPANPAPRDLTDVLRGLRPICRRVALRVRLGAPMAGQAVDCGAAMIGVDLAELALSERSGDDQLIAALERFRQAAEQARIEPYVWGLRRRTVVAYAVRAGFAMVNGAALMKDIGRPAKVLPAPKARFGAAG